MQARLSAPNRNLYCSTTSEVYCLAISQKITFLKCFDVVKVQ
jgi:hypothetical protein